MRATAFAAGKEARGRGGNHEALGFTIHEREGSVSRERSQQRAIFRRTTPITNDSDLRSRIIRRLRQIPRHDVQRLVHDLKTVIVR